MKSAFMPMGYRTNDGYVVSDETMQQLQSFFKEEVEVDFSSSEILRIVDVFHSIEKDKN